MASTSTSTSTSSTPFTVSFYATHAQDREGRTLNDILAFSDSDLEYHHDFIQILFPLPERSPINPSAPVINKATREAFLQRSELRREVLRALVRMCRFYGFQASTSDTKEREEGGDKGGKVEVFVRPSTSTQLWTSQSPLWLTRFSHNHLRITRIIRCLRVLGMEALAQGFHRTLLHNDPNGKISARTKMYWERAAKRGLHLAPEEEDDEARGVVWLRGQDGEAERDEDGDGGFDAAKGRMAVLGREEVGEV